MDRPAASVTLDTTIANALRSYFIGGADPAVLAIGVRNALLDNRWAAFTDNELNGLGDCFSHYTVDSVHHLVDEIADEIERRSS